MRADCKQYETRTYASGETVRKCNLDLAPDAPWRCPEHCPAYARRMADVNWTHGTLITPPTPAEPPGIDDGSAAAILDEAEDVVNAVLPEVLADVARMSPRAGEAERPWWRRFGRRR